MALEEEMRQEIGKIEREITVLDSEIERLYTKLSNLINIRRKKEYELRTLRGNFGIPDIEEKDLQTNLSRILRESM